ncbi:MAG: ClC family H(+)/Cl(-) exchange transporter [Treponema sp.]|jgi:H+/Cl- antiporter ClcA|nr:ClC family H(+)/Cl(-) exchange transporter [Treponema sp.]
MLENRRRIASFIRHGYHTRLALILESVFIGLAAGFVVVLFRYLLSQADILRFWLYKTLFRSSPYWTGGWILLLLCIGLFLGWASKVRPMIRGSGIPQIKGALGGQLSLGWTELPLKLITGVLGLGAGLSLGREGPSIQIGAYVGTGVLSVFHRSPEKRKSLVVAASAAGLSAAFNAPLAGVLFVLEELETSFSPLFLICAMGASMAADMAAGFFFGFAPIFDFRHVTALPPADLPWVVLLGVICAFLGDIFKRSLYASLNAYDRFRIPLVVRPAIPLLVSVPLGFFLFDLLGGGHGLIESLSREQWALGTVGLLLAGKILFTALCYGSGASGGIFLPLLACGALAGEAFGNILTLGGFIPEEQTLNFIILGMTAFFTGTVKAPVTGIILILEMSGNFNHLGSLVLASLSSFVTSELMGSPPVYAVLLGRILKSNNPSAGGPVRAGPGRQLG